MNWKDIAKDVSKAAPLIGTLLGGPAGGAVGGMISSALGTADDPAAIQQALATNPDVAVKLRQIEADQTVQLQTLLVNAENNRLQAESAEIQAINTSIQTEAKADHWPTYTWRPFIGFMFGCYVASMWLLPLFGKQPVTISTDLTLAIGGILGIASYFRGKMQADPAVQTDNRG